MRSIARSTRPGAPIRGHPRIVAPHRRNARVRSDRKRGADRLAATCLHPATVPDMGLMDGTTAREPVYDALDAATRAIAGLVSVDEVLQVIVDEVRPLVGARYAALGTVDDHAVIERFITSGMDPETRASIGPLPRGHGLLGLIVRENRSFRIPRHRARPAPPRLPAEPPADAQLPGRAGHGQGPVRRQPVPHGQARRRRVHRGRPAARRDVRAPRRPSPSRTRASTSRSNASRSSTSASGSVATSTTGSSRASTASGCRSRTCPSSWTTIPTRSSGASSARSTASTSRSVTSATSSSGCGRSCSGARRSSSASRPSSRSCAHNSMIDVELVAEPLEREPPAATTANLLGIVNEALSNVARHSRRHTRDGLRGGPSSMAS